MRMVEDLYLGDKAQQRRFDILQGLREGKLQPEVYVITPPVYGNNLLEIYPSAELLAPPLCDQDRLIVGIAVTYWEALEVVRRIVDDRVKRGELC
ncbi:MAG: hypothetical protein LUD07_12580 [Clostridiales bacterium]|nr:hypothetical protein [Clostridiales bacterium]